MLNSPAIRARELVEAILTRLRVAGMFDAERVSHDRDAVARRPTRAAEDRLAA
jgi:hypothetical protein